MTDSPRRDGTEPTQPLGNSYPAYTDPAYASQAPYGPTYQAPAVPNPTQPLPPYSPYGYDPYATGQYGPQYPPGEPPQPPPEPPKSPRWLWCGRGGGRADGGRTGHRAGDRQQLEAANGRRPVAVDARAQLHHTDTDADNDATHAPADHPGTDHRTAHRIGDPRRDRDGDLRGHRRRPGHQHHLRRHRQPAADRVQRHAAVEQGSRAARVRPRSPRA